MYPKHLHAKLFVLAVTVLACVGDQIVLSLPEQSRDGLRANFKQLLAGNPNYFGNVAQSSQPSTLVIVSDTSYEQLTSVGFNPTLGQLEATLEVKLPTGFGGGLCTKGSWEYVRFYADYGAGWDSVGYAAVNTHDIADGLECDKTHKLPLYYVVTLAYQPTQKNCSVPVLPTIRAILSWDFVPPDKLPNWSPVWGNVVDQHVQSPTTTPNLLLEKAFGFGSGGNGSEHGDPCNHVVPGAVSEHPESSTSSSPFPAREPTTGPTSGDLEAMAGDTTYEQLIDLGLDYAWSRLVATIRIKRPSGYDGSLCQNGSLEYISFWADWNNTCNWTYLGRLTINVHDIPHIPADGLTYSAALPANLDSARNLCNVTKIGRVRAALSWSTPPPTPPQLPPWGNWLERHVQLEPYLAFPKPTQPIIYTIGGVLLENIAVTGNGQTLPDGAFVGGQTTDPDYPATARTCPFGGTIYVTGPPIGPNHQYVYRLVYRSAPAADPAFDGFPVLNSITVTDEDAAPPGLVQYSPLNAQGYFAYLPTRNNVANLLARWTPDPGLWQIRLEVALATSFAPVGATPWYTVLVNSPANPAGPAGTLAFTNEPLCGDFPAGVNLTGTFSAVAPYFYQYLLDIVNAGIPNPIQLGGGLANPGTKAVPPPGAPWSLSTKDAVPCGYVLQLIVWDLTIYNSAWDGRYYVEVLQGFCVSKP
jgi:hypothetical protein